MVISTHNKRRRHNSQTVDKPKSEAIEEAEDLELNFSSDSSHLEHVATPTPSDASLSSPSLVDRYADIAVQTGLVVSKKKFGHILHWLQSAFEYSAPRFLLLSGPPGCGKSSAVQVACRQLQCEVLTWDAPLTASRGISMTLIDDFQSFAVGARYRSLLHENEDKNMREEPQPSVRGRHLPNQRRKILLIDDLPLHISDLRVHKETVQTLFGDIARYAPYPTVLLLSDNDKGVALLSRLILGQSLLQSHWITTISIPAVTNSMMKKRIVELLDKEKITVASRQLELFISCSNGDIRSTLNSLQLSTNSARGGRVPNNSRGKLRRNAQKRRKTNQKPEMFALTEFGRDNTLSMYHAVSKILNNKRTENGRSQYVAEEILDDARADPVSFVSFLHHNYPDFFRNSDDIVTVLSCLSEADALLSWRQENDMRLDLRECAASIVTRGFLLFNTEPNRKGWRPIHGPESANVAKESDNYVQYSKACFTRRIHPCLSTRSELCETLPYGKKIGELSVPKSNVIFSSAEEQKQFAPNRVSTFNDTRELLDFHASGNAYVEKSIEAEEDVSDPIEEWDD